MKELACSDVGFNCDTVAYGESMDDLLAQVAPHARDAHDVELTESLHLQLEALVREV